jgi:hypothetical protein
MTHRMRAWLVAALLGIAWTVAPSSPSDAQGEISGGDGVDVIIDVPNSAIVLAVQQLAKEKNRVLLASTAGTVQVRSLCAG